MEISKNLWRRKTGGYGGSEGETGVYAQSLFMMFNFDNTGYLHFCVHEWGTNGEECNPDFDRHTELVKSFT